MHNTQEHRERAVGSRGVVWLLLQLYIEFVAFSSDSPVGLILHFRDEYPCTYIEEVLLLRSIYL